MSLGTENGRQQVLAFFARHDGELSLRSADIALSVRVLPAGSNVPGMLQALLVDGLIQSVDGKVRLTSRGRELVASVASNAAE